LQAAICNVAAIGLSLNPAEKLAYLIPRNMKVDNKWVNKIFLEPSYMGLIRLATNSGSIQWANAALVYADDVFIDNGMGDKPEHKYTAFGKRGSVVGAYCVAKTSGGDYLTTIMSLDEINGIMERSESVKKARKDNKPIFGPWASDWGEQAKKTVIRRAFKTWPRSDSRMAEAVHLSNENEGFEPILTAPDMDKYTAKAKEFFDQIMQDDDDLEMYVLQQTTPRQEFTSLYHSFPDYNKLTKEQKSNGGKGKGFYQKIIDELLRTGDIKFDDYQKLFQEGAEIESEISETAYALIQDRAI